METAICRLAPIVAWQVLTFQIRDLRESGVDAVLAGGVYAIIGAIALQRGGELANRFVRERILPDIGLPQQGSDAA